MSFVLQNHNNSYLASRYSYIKMDGGAANKNSSEQFDY